MYLDYYGLKEKPFTLSPNPKYLYKSLSHREAMSQFIYSAHEQSGFMIITGEVGTGKTTLINNFLQTFPENCFVASIYHKIASSKGLLHHVFQQFNIPFSRETVSKLHNKLHTFLENKHREGKKAILILDEAQSLSLNLLEDIRILSNMEAFNEKYLTIFMLGQPELEEKLKNYDLRQLRDRITQYYNLRPLTMAETGAYIFHRLKVAGYTGNGSDFFTDGAIEMIYEYSKGIPRKINVISEKCLLTGYVSNIKTIDVPTIRRVQAEDSLNGDAAPRISINGSSRERYTQTAQNYLSNGVQENDQVAVMNYPPDNSVAGEITLLENTQVDHELKQLIRQTLQHMKQTESPNEVILPELTKKQIITGSGLLFIIFLFAQVIAVSAMAYLFNGF